MSAPDVRIGPLAPEGWQAAYPYARDDSAARARRDQMFLRRALRTHRRGIDPDQRAAYDARADRILAQLDPPPITPTPQTPAAAAPVKELPAQARNPQPGERRAA